MSRKRRRPSRPRPPSPAQAPPVPEEEAIERAPSARRARTASSRAGNSARGSRSASSGQAHRRRQATSAARGRPAQPMPPHPPLLRSLARGLAVVGSSPVLLTTTFLAVLAIWGVYSSAGLIRVTSPGVMAQLMAVPPVHAAFDANFFGVGTIVFSPATTLTLTTALLLVRSALVAFLVSLILEHLEGGDLAPGPLLGAALGRTRHSLRLVLPVEALFLVVMLGLPILLGPFIGPLAIAITFVGPAFFLVFAPVIAVRESRGLRESLRLSVRAARLRGPQHVLLVFSYVMATLFLFISTQGTAATPVTPTVVVWAYVLFVNVLHVAVLAGVVYRWLAVRDVVLQMAAEAPPRVQRTRPRGLRS
jgi:hypothetical protein